VCSSDLEAQIQAIRGQWHGGHRARNQSPITTSSFGALDRMVERG
jgi:hypothetical protein